MMFKTSIIAVVTLFVVIFGTSAVAGPIDFLKRVGHSIAQANRQATRTPQRSAHKRVKRTEASRNVDNKSEARADNVEEMYATKGAQPGAQKTIAPQPNVSQNTSEARPDVSQSASDAAANQPRAASSAPPVPLADLPYGVPVPNRPGFVVSPYSPTGGYVDIQGFTTGSPVKDPYTGKMFRVP